MIGSPVYWMRHDALALAAWLLGTLVAVGLAVPPPPRRGRSGQAALASLALAAVVACAGSPSAHAYAAFSARADTGATWGAAVLPTITAGRAAPYSLLAATSVGDSNNGRPFSSVSGNIGTTPGTTVTNTAGVEHSGTVERNTAAAKAAMADARTLATALEARKATARSATITGRVTPGVYAAAAFSTSGTITLDAAGDASARFVFVANSLSMATDTNVVLANGATAANVYWRIRGAATLGATVTIRGTLLADRDISAGVVTVVGRLVSLNGAISATRYVASQ